MVRVALLGRQFPEQLQANPEELRELEVVWVGSSHEAFRREVPGLGCKAVVVDLGEVSLEPARVRELVERSGAELGLVSYGYATRTYLRELRGDHLRVLQAPLGLATIRAHLAFMVVQDLLGAGAARSAPRQAAPHELGTCTCPDEVQHVVAELIAAEARERACGGRRALEDRHQQLEALTRQARLSMEDALVVARPPLSHMPSGPRAAGSER